MFESDSDRMVYLDLLRSCCEVQQLSLLGYCLMLNHVHLIVIPRRAEALPLVLKQTHGRYATYFNARHGASGHLWQGRYYSCPLDSAHLWSALRYTELNAVRAGMVDDAADYCWSSAPVHCGIEKPPSWLETREFAGVWGADEWRAFLDQSGAVEDTAQLRRNTHTGRPLGDGEFVARLEKALQRQLVPQRGGRPRKRVAEGNGCLMMAEG